MNRKLKTKEGKQRKKERKKSKGKIGHTKSKLAHWRIFRRGLPKIQICLRYVSHRGKLVPNTSPAGIRTNELAARTHEEIHG